MTRAAARPPAGPVPRRGLPGAGAARGGRSPPHAQPPHHPLAAAPAGPVPPGRRCRPERGATGAGALPAPRRPERRRRRRRRKRKQARRKARNNFPKQTPRRLPSQRRTKAGGDPGRSAPGSGGAPRRQTFRLPARMQPGSPAAPSATRRRQGHGLLRRQALINQSARRLEPGGRRAGLCTFPGLARAARRPRTAGLSRNFPGSAHASPAAASRK